MNDLEKQIYDYMLQCRRFNNSMDISFLIISFLHIDRNEIVEAVKGLISHGLIEVTDPLDEVTHVRLLTPKEIAERRAHEA